MDIEKEKRAIQYLRSFEPEEEPYYLCYSGGKDSDAIRILAQLAGVKHECKHNLTTVDAPETVRYVRETIGKENINYPKESMWQLIVRKRMPPTRIARYCCEVLKERGGEGRLQITGVRWDESRKRKENAGIVRIIGKEKTMKRKAIEDDVNFLQTPIGGGGIKYRQRKRKEICRVLLPYNEHDDKPDRGLDGQGCVGIFKPLRL